MRTTLRIRTFNSKKFGYISKNFLYRGKKKNEMFTQQRLHEFYISWKETKNLIEYFIRWEGKEKLNEYFISWNGKENIEYKNHTG